MRTDQNIFYLCRSFFIFAALLMASLPYDTRAENDLSTNRTISIVATTTDLAALASIVGGNHASVTAIAKGTQDPHQIEAKPSYILKLKNADLLISHGLELESAWLQPLIQNSRNNKLIQQKQTILELGPHLEPIDVPTQQVSRAEGDVHPGGNPHFQLDPIRMAKAAEIIAQRLSELNPSQAKYYSHNAQNFATEAQRKTDEWSARLKKTSISKVVTYHKTLNYFLARFGIKNVMQIEPKPGIPPTAAHLIKLFDTIRNENISLVLIENYFDNDAGQKIQRTFKKVHVQHVAVSVGGESGLDSPFDVIEKLVKVFEKAESPQ